MGARRKPPQPTAKPAGNAERARSAPESSPNRGSERRSGEGADSALARLKRVERDRRWSIPEDDEQGQ
jgi:hypothetical protein